MAKKISQKDLLFQMEMEGSFMTMSRGIVKHIITNYFKSVGLESPDDVDVYDTDFIIEEIDFEYETLRLWITKPIEFIADIPFTAIFNNTWDTGVDFWAKHQNDNSTTTIIKDRMGPSGISNSDLVRYWKVRDQIVEIVNNEVVGYIWSDEDRIDTASEILGVEEPEVNQVYFATNPNSGDNELAIEFSDGSSPLLIPFENLTKGTVRKFVEEWLKSAK